MGLGPLQELPSHTENVTSDFEPSYYGLDGIGVDDHILNPLIGILARVTVVNSATSLSAKGVLDWTSLRSR